MNGIKMLLLILLGSYLLLTGWLLFFQNGSIDRQTYYQDQERVANLVPFSSINPYLRQARENGGAYRHRAVRLIGGNLVMLLPWGFLAPLIFNFLNRTWRVVLSGLAISLAAELIQYICRIGVFETDDLLLNTSGALLGYVLLKQLVRSGPSMRQEII
jgi:glycopeptide antibiotics resistance protein